MIDDASQPKPDAATPPSAAAEETPPPAPPPADFPWVQLDDATLLTWRVADLDVRIEGSPVEPRIHRLHEELAARGLAYRPVCYLATEWLCPDRVPAVGIPFCLTHPRLTKLERVMMLEVEGEQEAEFMRLLRHETGHAINYAYNLYRRTRWRELFGSMDEDYDPHEYYMRPYSRQYVVHLSNNYAQAHPDEDFAETFAVWLTPGQDWRLRYRGWGALKKLEYVDRLMQDIANKPPAVRGGPRRWAASRTRATLASYFRAKRKEFAKAYIGFYDPVLKRLFTAEAAPGRLAADRFLQIHRRQLRDTISSLARTPKFAVDHLIRRLAQRAEELKLYVAAAPESALLPVGICLTSLVLEARAQYLRDVKEEVRP